MTIEPSKELPRHDDFDPVTRAVELASLAAALLLLVCQTYRLASEGNLGVWWVPPILAASVLAADFISGIVHWFADTWFDESVPFLGPRFLRPFRVHHINPDAFLCRDWIDTNGDVAMLTIPILSAVFWLPLHAPLGAATALFLVALSAAALPTNQVHQWAHLPEVPRWVAWLQRRGFILRPGAHQLHHQPPHVANYCILTGWCNPLLASVDFFPRFERLVTRITGCQPRHDDGAYRDRYEEVLSQEAR